MLLLRQMIVLLTIMLIGYLAARKNILDNTTVGKLSDIIVKIANPALILSGGMNADLEIRQFLRIFALASILFAALVILSYLLMWVMKIPQEQSGIYRCMLVFTNIGFMGFPLVRAMYGEEAVLYASIFVIPFNILIYTFGIYQIEGKDCRINIKKICNTGVLACVGAIAITLSGVSIPVPLKELAGYLGDLTAPLSMMVIGASFLQTKPGRFIEDRTLNIFLLIKMLLLPVLITGILKKAGVEGTILGVCMVMIAAPVGSMNAMLSQRYPESCLTATRAVAVSSVCAVITRPLVALFL